MKQKIQISIPEPCQEGWQNMTPVEKGRFCSSCQKTVLDYTNLSDNEIIKLVSKNDNLCGRFNVTQLDRDLIETRRTSNYFGYFATSVLAFLGLGTSNIVAQEKPILEQTDNKYQYKPTDTIQKITVSGVVTDSVGKPLHGATVKIKNILEGTQTDEYGKYSLSVNSGAVLQFIYLGCETVEITVSSNNINVRMNKGNIMIEGGIITNYKKRTFFGRTFRKIRNWFR